MKIFQLSLHKMRYLAEFYVFSHEVSVFIYTSLIQGYETRTVQ